MIEAVGRHVAGIAALLLLTACNREGAGCWTGLGDADSLVLILSEEIDRVTVTDRIDVTWIPSDGTAEQRLSWKAGSGMMQGLTAEVLDGELMLSDRNTCRWVRPLDAVPSVVLEGLDCREWHLEGQGSFAMGDTLHGGDLRVFGDEMSADARLLFDGDTLQVRMPNGIGDVSVSGRAARLRSFRSGFGDFDGSGLEAAQVLFHHAGLGDAQLNAVQYLFLEVAGTGNTYLEAEAAEQVVLFLEGGTGEVLIGP